MGKANPLPPTTVPVPHRPTRTGLKLSANPEVPTDADPDPAGRRADGADPVVDRKPAAVREDQAAWEVPAVGRA